MSKCTFSQDVHSKLSTIRVEFDPETMTLTENDEPDLGLTLMHQSRKYVSSGEAELQSAPCILKPYRATVEENTIVFILPPSIVNKLEAKQYLLDIVLGSKVICSTRCLFRNLMKGEYVTDNVIENVPPRRRRIPVTNPEAANAGAAVPPAVPDPKEAAARESDKPAGLGSIPNPKPIPAAGAVPPEAPQPVPLPPAVPIEKKSQSNLALILGAAAAAVLVAGAAWYFLGSGNKTDDNRPADGKPVVEAKQEAAEPAKEERQPEAEPAKQSEPEPSAASSPSPQPEPAPAPKAEVQPQPAPAVQPTEEQKPVRSVREEVRGFFAAPERSVDGALALSKKLSAETAEDQDALFRLWYFAAQGGSAEAAVPYANALDPTTPQWGSIRKDADEALAFYRKGGANAQVDALLEYLKKAAEAGDAQARRTLNKYQ